MSEAVRPATEVAAGETFWERAATTRWGRYLTAAERETLVSAAIARVIRG